VDKKQASSAPRQASSAPNAAQVRERLARALNTQISGFASSGASAEIDPYHAIIQKILDEAWERARPAWADASREAWVAIRIYPDGTLQAMGIKKSSGDAVMDQAALEAIRLAKRLPQPLPQGLGNPTYDQTICFRLNDASAQPPASGIGP
jgi:protein TonB